VARIIITRAILAAATVAIAVLAVAASASSSDSSGRAGRVHVIQVHRDVGHDFIIDADHSATPDHPAPDSPGDQDVFNGKFFAGDKQVGTDGGVCTLVELPSIYHCNATNWFDKGQLTVQFIADFSSPEPGHFAITGGTGAYRGATGEVTFVAKPDGADVTFRFQTP
jgi:Allene oxide cyclase barrel like domain